MVEPKTELGVALIERSVTKTQAGSFKQVGQGGRSKRCPVLAGQYEEIRVVMLPVDSSISEADCRGAGANRADVAIVGAAEVALKINFYFAGDDDIG